MSLRFFFPREFNKRLSTCCYSILMAKQFEKYDFYFFHKSNDD